MRYGCADEYTTMKGMYLPVYLFLASVIAGVAASLASLMTFFVVRRRATYANILMRTARHFAQSISMDEVAASVIEKIKDVLKPKKTIIFLYDPSVSSFVPQARDGARTFAATIARDHILVRYLHKERKPLVKDALIAQRNRERSSARREEQERVIAACAWIDASAILPLTVDRMMTGIVVLGDTRTGRTYARSDMKFLETFAVAAAPALENARLYQESCKFGEQKQQEAVLTAQELARVRTQLNDLDKAKSEFLSIASHQLYTPLTALRGYISMLLEQDFGEVSEQHRPVLDILNKSATRLIDLIKNLLDISRIESGRLELNLDVVDLAELAEELVQDLLPNAMKKRLDLQFIDPIQPVGLVVVDRERMRQVMLNFIDNAIKYTSEGKIRVRASRHKDSVHLSVEDTGKGISREDIPLLFNKFTRVGASSRYNTEGTGLGLYVARQIIKEHRGEVFVESSGEGKGSIFTMVLPAIESPTSLKVGQEASVVIKAEEARKGSM